MGSITPNIRTVAVTSTPGVVVPAGSRILAVVNIGANRATLGTSSSIVADVGYPMAAAAVAGDQGGGISFTEGTVTENALYAVSASGTTLCIFGA